MLPSSVKFVFVSVLVIVPKKEAEKVVSQEDNPNQGCNTSIYVIIHKYLTILIGSYPTTSQILPSRDRCVDKQTKATWLVVLIN